MDGSALWVDLVLLFHSIFAHLLIDCLLLVVLLVVLLGLLLILSLVLFIMDILIFCMVSLPGLGKLFLFPLTRIALVSPLKGGLNGHLKAQLGQTNQ